MPRTPTPMWDRFWPKVEATGFCWLWTAAQDGGGYGQIWSLELGRRTQAHRVAYEMLVGPIPPQHHLDHLCRVTLCVNPDHLEPVLPVENQIERGMGAHLIAARAARCTRGHALTPDNVDVQRDRIDRFGNHPVRCRTCRRERVRRARQKED